MNRYSFVLRKNDLGRMLRIALIALIALACTYILTDLKLSAPAVFSGLVGFGTVVEVMCCYEVKNATPTSLDAELAKYGEDPDLAAQMKSIKGYRYIYTAKRISDKRRWTPLMKTLASNDANPNDGTPFSAAVVAAQFDKPTLPASFMANGVPMRLRTDVDNKAGRIIYTFTRAGNKVEISENSFAD